MKRTNKSSGAVTTIAITTIEYGGLQAAFDHLNRVLFIGTLPNVFITYDRRARSGGYFSAGLLAYRTNHNRQPVIALNPDGFVGRDDEFIVSILLHEMVHLWQHVHGKNKPWRAYHNREWAQMMIELGLMPSSTGMVGGKITGSRMAHYIIDGGAFAQAFAKLAATGWKLNLESAQHLGDAKSPPSKVKSTCPNCDGNGWTKPNYSITCTVCGVVMIPETSVVQSYAEAAEIEGAAMTKLNNETLDLLTGEVIRFYNSHPAPDDFRGCFNSLMRDLYYADIPVMLRPDSETILISVAADIIRRLVEENKNTKVWADAMEVALEGRMAAEPQERQP